MKVLLRFVAALILIYMTSALLSAITALFELLIFLEGTRDEYDTQHPDRAAANCFY